MRQGPRIGRRRKIVRELPLEVVKQIDRPHCTGVMQPVDQREGKAVAHHQGVRPLGRREGLHRHLREGRLRRPAGFEVEQIEQTQQVRVRAYRRAPGGSRQARHRDGRPRVLPGAVEQLGHAPETAVVVPVRAPFGEQRRRIGFG